MASWTLCAKNSVGFLTSSTTLFVPLANCLANAAGVIDATVSVSFLAFFQAESPPAKYPKVLSYPMKSGLIIFHFPV